MTTASAGSLLHFRLHRLGWPKNGITFSVPSGNFGNAYAAYVARKMGVPINQIIVATNANDVLSHVIETGVFRKMKDLDETDEFALDAAPFQNLHTVFSTFSVNQAQTLDATKTIYDEKGRKLDPHTCIALVATQSAAAQKKGPCVVVATANPIKFAETHTMPWVFR